MENEKTMTPAQEEAINNAYDKLLDTATIKANEDGKLTDKQLDELAENFNLSKPYLSKYIKENAGITFQEAVKKARMKKARSLLKESNQTVESIAATVGYENVEHFNRLFKKSYGMTPVQFRRESR